MLGLVLKEDPLAIVSAHGKKKKKSAANPKPGYDLVFKGERTLYFLSSLLDVLLLKKDISKRFASTNDISLFASIFFCDICLKLKPCHFQSSLIPPTK